MKNPIMDFVDQGKSLSTEEGRRLIINSPNETIKDAAKDLKVMSALISASNESSDTIFRRKVLLAVGGATKK